MNTASKSTDRIKLNLNATAFRANANTNTDGSLPRQSSGLGIGGNPVKGQGSNGNSGQGQSQGRDKPGVPGGEIVTKRPSDPQKGDVPPTVTSTTTLRPKAKGTAKEKGMIPPAGRQAGGNSQTRGIKSPAGEKPTAKPSVFDRKPKGK